jgi:hypothetical protein
VITLFYTILSVKNIELESEALFLFLLLLHSQMQSNEVWLWNWYAVFVLSLKALSPYFPLGKEGNYEYLARELRQEHKPRTSKMKVYTNHSNATLVLGYKMAILCSS